MWEDYWKDLLKVNMIVSHVPVRGGWRLVLEDLRNSLKGRIKLVARKHNVLYLEVDYEDPVDAVEDLRGLLPSDTLILRAIPVHAVVHPPEASLIREAVRELLNERPPGSFAIRLEGKVDMGGRAAGRMEAVKVIAEASDRPVNLDSPDILVLVKPFRIGGFRGAAVYVGPPSGIFSAARG